MVAGLRGSNVRVERRLDGTIAVRRRDRYMEISEYNPRPKAITKTRPAAPLPPKGPKKSAAKRFGQIDLRKSVLVWVANRIG